MDHLARSRPEAARSGGAVTAPKSSGRLRRMADEAERENPPIPIAELLGLQRALYRAIPRMRALRAAGLDVGAPALTGRISRLCRQMEELTGQEAAR